MLVWVKRKKIKAIPLVEAEVILLLTSHEVDHLNIRVCMLETYSSNIIAQVGKMAGS